MLDAVGLVKYVNTNGPRYAGHSRWLRDRSMNYTCARTPCTLERGLSPTALSVPLYEKSKSPPPPWHSQAIFGADWLDLGRITLAFIMKCIYEMALCFCVLKVICTRLCRTQRPLIKGYASMNIYDRSSINLIAGRLYWYWGTFVSFNLFAL